MMQGMAAYEQEGHPTDGFGKVSVRIRPLLPSDFLERIVTSNFRGVKNLRSVVLGLLKMNEKGQNSQKT